MECAICAFELSWTNCKTCIILGHICALSLDKHAAIMMGIMKIIKTIPWLHMCVELRIISSTNSGLIKWSMLRSTSLSTANQIEIAHSFTWWVHALCICTFRSKNQSQKNFASLNQSGKRFTRGLGMSHHFLRMPWKTCAKILIKNSLSD